MSEPTRAGLTRVTANLTPRALAALDALTAGGANRTDAICAALRVAAVVNWLADDQGCLTVLGADGTRERIHLP